MLKRSGYTIFNCIEVALGGQLSDIELKRVMRRPRRYSIFNGEGVSLGRRLSNIRWTITMPRLSGDTIISSD